ncbi:MAG: glycine zipper 2TM domain-containing protein [Alphaproteobacteria bacterium]|nr:glycine zipper 2TM domain-containing protein [Alphaproteobacteria bacterium]
MKNLLLIPLMIAALSLGACETMQQSGNKQKIGAVSGAVVGGLLGSKVGGGSGQLWATGAGAIIGGLLGSEIGNSLDRADMVYAANASERAHSAPVGETISWSNPESGHSGSITPVREGKSTAGRYCREYEQEIRVDGRRETAVGQACQNSDGTWQVVS